MSNADRSVIIGTAEAYYIRGHSAMNAARAGSLSEDLPCKVHADILTELSRISRLMVGNAAFYNSYHVKQVLLVSSIWVKSAYRRKGYGRSTFQCPLSNSLAHPIKSLPAPLLHLSSINADPNRRAVLGTQKVHA